VERFKTHGIPTDHVAEMRERYGRVVQACYQDMDKRIGTILEKAQGPDTLVLIVSDHGFGEAPFPHPTKTEPYGGNHRDDGVILAQAPWIQAGVAIEDASVLDIMPTLLKLFKQPVAEDMPGKVLDALLDDATRAQNIPQIKSYEAKPQLKIPYKSGWPARKFRPLAEDK
jgi:predicted AlkP superfamily phosphohydrolase/phosphomutase